MTSSVSPFTSFSKIISYLFHPLLMPTYGLLLYFWVDSSAAYFMKADLRWILIGMTFSFTFFLPLLNTLILLRARYIQSIHMHTRQERRVPLLVTALFYMAEYWLLHDRDVPQTLKLFILCATIAIVCTVVINLFWKISAHMVGIGGVCGAMFVLCYLLQFQGGALLMAGLLLLAGIIGSARLQLGEHHPLEVFAGFLLGAACPFIFMVR
ncbi:MAG TPA: hypothetical protein VI112_02685 [Bacteroidia bacterium]|jgi:hypothetical protein